MPLPPSAADWIRNQRLRGAKSYDTTIQNNRDVINKVTTGNPFNAETLQSRVVGSSKTRREASKWIDFIGSRNETFLQKTSNYNFIERGIFKATQVKSTRLCNCSTSVLEPKSTGCIKCNYM
jgi:hypothetical protein